MVQFKLQHRGLVRKVTFKNVEQPSWHELSWKIGDVCNIPHAAVALTYLDPDGDKITISSQAELKEYYASLDEDELDSNVPHKFIVRNLNDGIPDPDAADPSEDNFLMRDARTMAASTVGGGSQWGFNPEDEAERDPTKLRLSGYSTFADALSPLAGSATEPDDDKSDSEELPGGFHEKPQEPNPPPAKTSTGWGLPLSGFGWGRSSNTNTQTSPQTNTQTNPQPAIASSPPADPDSKLSNPWAANNIEMSAKTPSWAAASATTPSTTKAPPTPWGAPASIATGNASRLSFSGKSGAPTVSTTTASTRNPSSGSTAIPNTLIPPPIPTVQMDTMVADRASSYAASPAVTAVFPKSGKKSKKKMTHREREAERQREEEARREEEKRVEEEEMRAMEREAERERQENARYSAEAAARAVTEEARRMLRIVSSVDELLTKILPNRPAASPYVPSNMELEPRIPTPSVTPTPIVPAEPEFGVPPSDYGGSFEYANRGRQGGVPVINVPRPKYPASSLTREGYSTGTTPPTASSGYGFARSTHASPERSAHGRSRSRAPPGDFEIVPPSHLPPQARMVIPPPVVPGEETDESPITPGFARQTSHEGGLVLADPERRGPTSAVKADMENAKQHYKSQRDLYKLEKAERKKEMEERAAAKAERKRAKAAASADPNIADLKNQLGDIVPPRPYEAERRYVENPYENPRSAAPYSNSTRGSSTVYAEGLGQVTLMPMFPSSSASAVTAPVSPVRDDATTPGFERARRRRQSMNASPERYHQPPPSVASRTESYHGLQPDAYPGAAHHAPPYMPAQPPQQDLAKRVALKLTEMGYTPQKYPTLPSIVGHRIRPIMNTHGVNENELAYLIVQDLFKYSGQN
ncbi:hypothetical protein FRC07_000205 [Ceratobasidium sp. 392]|nr:hypothetical protein FRC07_000205 [Ceratobasidium sp. 392]